MSLIYFLWSVRYLCFLFHEMFKLSIGTLGCFLSFHNFHGASCIGLVCSAQFSWYISHLNDSEHCISHTDTTIEY